MGNRSEHIANSHVELIIFKIHLGEILLFAFRVDIGKVQVLDVFWVSGESYFASILQNVNV